MVPMSAVMSIPSTITISNAPNHCESDSFLRQYRHNNQSNTIMPTYKIRIIRQALTDDNTFSIVSRSSHGHMVQFDAGRYRRTRAASAASSGGDIL
jgi:hypothetical protein